MKAAVVETPSVSDAIDADRLRAIVLARVACAARGLTQAELAADVAPLAVHRLSAAHARALLERQSDALADAGLVKISGARLQATEAGLARAALFLGLKDAVPHVWSDVRDIKLVAKVLGLERESAKRLKALAKPDGLRAALVQRAFKLKLKGAATPSRLRSALAAMALERAFGNQIKAGLSGKLGMSAKAGRLLAGQLARKPRDFGTDTRLIAALAAEHVGATNTALAALQIAVLRGYVDGPAAAIPTRRRPAPPELVPAKPRLVELALGPPPAIGRPDLAGFAREVHRQASARAQGWPGNRKAYISHVWQVLRESQPGWGISEIEFKCMLTEAHRAGQLALANADLKEGNSIKDLQESAVVYKNAVFHFIRVDA